MINVKYTHENNSLSIHAYADRNLYNNLILSHNHTPIASISEIINNNKIKKNKKISK